MVWNVFKKEIKDSLRDRKTFMLMTFLPIVLVIGVVFFMDRFMQGDESIDNVTVAVAQQTDANVLAMVKEIPQAEVQVADDPIAEVQDGKARVALLTAADFAQKMQAGQTAELTLFADSSSFEGSKALSYIQEQFESYKQALTTQRLQAQNVDPAVIQPFVVKVESAQQTDESLAFISYILPMIVLMMTMLGALPAAIDLFAGEKERKTVEALLMTPIPRRVLIVGKWMAITAIGIGSGVLAVLSFSLSMKFVSEKMSGAMQIGENGGQVLLFAVLGIIMTAMLFAALLMTVSMMAKTFKEAQSYLSPIMMVAIVPVVVLFGKAPNELTWVHFSIPFVNIAAFAKELVYGVASGAHLALMAVSTLALLAIVLGVGSWMYGKDRWVLGK